MSRALLGRVLAPLSELGWRNGVLYLCARVLERGSGGRARLIRYHLVAQPVPADPRPQCRPSATQTVRQVEPDDPVVSQFPRPAAVIARRFGDQATCFVARSGERFSGFLWLARGAYEEDEVRCRYELCRHEISAWDFDVHVEPDFRIGRSFARLWDAANQYLASNGVRWSFSRISAFNPGSLSAHGRLGIRHLYSATFLCLGPLQLAVVGAPPYLHLSLSARSRPILRLHPPAGE